jgi:trimeric autotransporter adhesin
MKKHPKNNAAKPVNIKLAFFLIPVILAGLALPPTAHAQLSPPPDGGYPGNNTAEGTDALFGLTTGTENTALGFNALYSNTTGGENTATGSTALLSNTTGIRNTANGFAALQSNTTGERNTATGRAALANNTAGTYNTASGHSAMFFNTIGIRNTAVGSFALVSNTTGNHNTATGYAALNFNTTGNYNAANGYFALYQTTTGNNNTATGYNALLNNTTGHQNIALGNFAGSNLTTGDNNIDIGNQGVAGEGNTIRIGTTGIQCAAYIAGISGVNVGRGRVVEVDASGRLGTRGSSRRFKDQIKPMDNASEAILALKPVTFRYKKEIDPDGISQFGLIAEDVAKINPDLVDRDTEGKVYTVRYEAVNAMLLNEFLKEHQQVQEQQKQIEKLAAQLEEQAEHIRRVNDKVEMAKFATQVVVNDR